MAGVLAVRVAGAVYLVYLGVQSLRAARRGHEPAGPGSLRLTPKRALRQGLAFLSLLPQFASPERGVPGMVLLGLLFCLLTSGWLALDSAAAARARAVLTRPRARRVLDAVTGWVLVGFGARLALQQR